MVEETDNKLLKPKKTNVKKYTFQFFITSINIILLYLLIRYVIYPILYTVFY